MNDSSTGGTNTVGVKNGSKQQVILIIVIAVVLVLGIFTAVILHRPNLTMSDFGEINKISAIIKFGIPTDINDDGDLIYRDCIKFYGVTLSFFNVNCDKGEYTIVENDEDKQSDIIHEIRKRCDYDGSSGIFSYFSYKDDLRITTIDSPCFIQIEVR